MIHDLKIWPEHFQNIADGIKRFEVRRNDRGYYREDLLRLREWEDALPGPDKYTGREMTVRVSHVHSGLGMAPGYVCMSIETVDERTGAPSSTRSALALHADTLQAHEIRLCKIEKGSSRSPFPNLAATWSVSTPKNVEYRPWWYSELLNAYLRVKELEGRLAVYDEACATDGIEGRESVICKLQERVKELEAQLAYLNNLGILIQAPSVMSETQTFPKFMIKLTDDDCRKIMPLGAHGWSWHDMADKLNAVLVAKLHGGQA